MKERYREIGLAAFFLLFVVGMSTDIPAMLQKKEEQGVLAATTEKPKKPTPKPTITPTPTIAWPTWTPTPTPSGTPSTPPAPESSQPEPTATPQSVVPTAAQTSISSTPTPNIVGQSPSEPGRGGGLMNVVDEILDPLNHLVPSVN